MIKGPVSDSTSHGPLGATGPSTLPARRSPCSEAVGDTMSVCFSGCPRRPKDRKSAIHVDALCLMLSVLVQTTDKCVIRSASNSTFAERNPFYFLRYPYTHGTPSRDWAVRYPANGVPGCEYQASPTFFPANGDMKYGRGSNPTLPNP